MSTERAAHRPVLLDESLDALAIRRDGVYVDGTFGRGGHSRGILSRLGPGGRLVAFDKDPEAVAVARARFGDDGRFSIERGSFAMLGSVAEELGIAGRVDGVLLDLGVSSPQLDDAARGFSFQKPGPLDMRMDPEGGPSAAEWLNSAGESEIADVLWRYGEERHSRRIARALVRARSETRIADTSQLADLIARAVPGRERHKHPATRSFQAIRIFINRELEDLELCLEQVPDILAPGGRLAVISFHSLEDRLVKRFMRREAQGVPAPRGLPVTDEQLGVRMRVVGKAVRPRDEEIGANPRARSAVLRVAERLS